MAGYFENFSRAPVKLVTVPNWHRRDEGGSKVKGNHKASNVTDTPEELMSKIEDPGERMKQLAGKLNNMIRNVGAKKGVYDYKVEAEKWAEAFKNNGGTWTAAQDKAIQMNLSSRPQNRDWFDAFKHNFGLPNVDNGVGHPAAADIEAPVQEAPPVQPMVAKRPEETPTRGPSEAKRRRIHADAAENRITAATTTTTTTEAAEPIEVDAPVIEAPPVAAAAVEGTANMAAPGPVATDPSGAVPMEFIQSHPAQVRFEGNNQFFCFGGTRVMYSWAYEFFAGTVPALNNIAANELDGVIVGHSIPWEWIPFYCTPAEYSTLPFGEGDVYIDKVRLRVTPMAKETQFTTNGATSGVASQEHLCLGKVAIGLNHKWPQTAVFRAAEGGGGGTASPMTYSTSGVSKVDYSDLSKRYWGNLNRWTSGVSPYATPTSVSGGTTTAGNPRPTAEMNIREIETVQLMLWDKWDTSTQLNNTSCWGVPRLDLFVKRFPFMSAIGKPIVDEEYHPKNGLISYVPHVNVQNKQSVNGKFFGPKNTFFRPLNNATINNKDNVSFNQTDFQYISRNSNIGTKESILGSYHGAVEKVNLISAGPHGSVMNDCSNRTMPSICLGMEPIKPIDFSTSLGVPIQARAMWKIDYQIVFRIERPEHIYHWPYATHIKPSAGGTTPSIYQKSGPAICRREPIAEICIQPFGYDATAVGQPSYEEPPIENIHHNINGQAYYKGADSNYTLADVAGTGFTNPAALGANGLSLTSDS
jgi:hypothetical protein